MQLVIQAQCDDEAKPIAAFKNELVNRFDRALADKSDTKDLFGSLVPPVGNIGSPLECKGKRNYGSVKSLIYSVCI